MHPSVVCCRCPCICKANQAKMEQEQTFLTIQVAKIKWQNRAKDIDERMFYIREAASGIGITPIAAKREKNNSSMMDSFSHYLPVSLDVIPVQSHRKRGLVGIADAR